MWQVAQEHMPPQMAATPQSYSRSVSMIFSPAFASTSCSTPSRSTTRNNGMPASPKETPGSGPGSLPIRARWRQPAPVRMLARRRRGPASPEPTSRGLQGAWDPCPEGLGPPCFGAQLGGRRVTACAPLPVPEPHVQIEQPDGGGELALGHLTQAGTLQQDVRVRTGRGEVRKRARDIQQRVVHDGALPIDEHQPPGRALDEVRAVQVVVKDGHRPVRRAAKAPRDGRLLQVVLTQGAARLLQALSVVVQGLEEVEAAGLRRRYRVQGA